MSICSSAVSPDKRANGLHGRRWVLFAVSLLIMSTAVLLRSYNLLSLPIFNDEAVYLRWAADILDQRTRMALFIPVAEDGKQPLYIWLATGAMAMFSDPLLSGRIVSVVAGLFSVVGIMLAGRWLQGNLLGLLAGLLYAITPYVVFFDRMALADSVISSTAIWTFCLGVFIARKVADDRGAILCGAVLGTVMAVGVWTKATALFVVPFPVLCLLALPRNGRLSRPGVRSLVVVYVVFAALASFLVIMPYAEVQLRLTATHVFSSEELAATRPMNVWLSNAGKYWSWIQAYLPAPLYWLVLGAAGWGLLFRRRETLLLLGCWLSIVLPSMVLARTFSSRYMLSSIFLLILMAVIPAKDLWMALRRRWKGKTNSTSSRVIAIGLSASLALAITGSSILFDYRLVTDPPSAPWAESDRNDYVEGWPSGYGFNEALTLALRRAEEYDRNVFILSDHFQGLPFDGLALYVRGIPRVRHYVDARIAWGEDGIADTWRSHAVPLILFRNDGRGSYEPFESRVPEAKLIGTFWKPGGKKSFRVYELDPESVPPKK